MGVRTDEVRRLREFENAQSRNAASKSTLDKPLLTEAATGNLQTPLVAAPASTSSGRS